MDILHLTATEISRKISAGDLTSEAATTAFLDRIAASNPQINSFISIAGDRAIERAKQLDKTRTNANGKSDSKVSPLRGVPIAVKDVLCTVDVPTTCASKMLEKFVSPYNAGVVERLDAAGLVTLGKTNMDEFAMGGSTENSAFGITKNPWDLSRTPGGSSGGSAACLAAAQAPISIGTDTGGSIRQPAAFCGVCGLKPTYGRVSRYGLVAFASSLDQVGPMAHSVEDLALLLQVISGHDDRDSTSIPEPVPDYAKVLGKGCQGLRIGIVRDQLDSQGLDAEIRQSILKAIDVFRQAGATIVDVALPNTKHAVATYYIIAPSEASSNLSRYSGAHYGFRSAPNKNLAKDSSALIDMYCRSRSEGFGKEVKRRIMLGTYTLSAGYYDAYYLKALKVRRLIRQDYDAAFAKADVILGPTTPSTAFKLGEKTSDPVQMYLDDLFTVGANLAGIPALSLPCGQSTSGLPIGMQLQAPPLAEATLLQTGHAYQQLTQTKPQWPQR
ncbi:MAG: Asp-tRNA(Asn)/Glu-tRNA(Gln) amidotransferase subunit GatA [Pirellulaceae bacterium]|nr:Asp-tRNA(Asn)/Glu-tRNA(Gln) amidotransferase subunit GatA [Pirellulaceae bacterium]